MKNLTLILPFAIPPAEFLTDFRKSLKMPALSQLFAGLEQTSTHSIDDFSPALPHEYWQAGMHLQAPVNSPPVAWHLMQSAGIPVTEGFWFLLQPIHIHVARDHLVLTDTERLEISQAEAEAFFAIAAEVAAEYGLTLQYGNPQQWFVRADKWCELRTSTTAAASGHNIDIWMPRGEGERQWRQFQNEIQMRWHDHPLNQEREMRGLRTVNSVWISCGAGQHLPSFQNSVIWSGKYHADQHPVLQVNTLSSHALNSDWGMWLDQMQTLDQTLFAPVLAELQSGKWHSVTVLISDSRKLCTLTCKKVPGWKFWQRGSLEPLFGAAA
ncbi:hypothetical protein [Undibacterium squillarum]|uniref:Cofactor-independent phosphoglycerate mutase n=1 Tax=Undibacterium squillarum TaxID=1131567 RepID=A0ABQ2XRR3_9BURK|nr:hypothetical protein [Undibacterium squillarum]GGX28845.1 hypothetical protein GCM10010946_02040 [Undibacterium squillarum]